jgi:hypothetical protein
MDLLSLIIFNDGNNHRNIYVLQLLGKSPRNNALLKTTLPQNLRTV